MPPSYSECPNCVKPAAPVPVAAAAPAPRPMPIPLPVEPVPVPGPVPVPSPAPATRQMGHFQTSAEPLPPPTLSVPTAYAAPASKGLPGWLAAILSLVGVAALSYFAIQYFTRPASPAAAETESAQPTQQAAEAHPLAKFVEITGLRITQDQGRAALKFLVVNHSAGNLGGFNLEVDVKAAGSPAEAPALFTVKAPVKNIGPLESREFTVPVTATVKGYELPDWQFLRASFRITE